MAHEPASNPSLAQRHAQLVHACASQRGELQEALTGVFAPLSGGAGMLRLPNMKVPLIVAGVALGFLVTRPRKILALLPMAVGLWRMAGPLIETVRQASSAAEPPHPL